MCTTGCECAVYSCQGLQLTTATNNTDFSINHSLRTAVKSADGLLLSFASQGTHGGGSHLFTAVSSKVFTGIKKKLKKNGLIRLVFHKKT